MLSRWAPLLHEVQMVPSDRGRFEVTLDDELVFSKAALGRHAEPGEVVALLEQRIGPAVR